MKILKADKETSELILGLCQRDQERTGCVCVCLCACVCVCVCACGGKKVEEAFLGRQPPLAAFCQAL